MKINTLPAPTFWWLGVNHSEINDGKIGALYNSPEGERASDVSIPCSMRISEMGYGDISKDFPCGLGDEAAKALTDSHIKIFRYTVDAGAQDQSPAVISRTLKDGENATYRRRQALYLPLSLTSPRKFQKLQRPPKRHPT